ncbi:MAG TPA: hypothetical protein VN018_03085, partial [Brevundimonas sp.]|nr:hypothetical protein [Brevundimonas sp.]
MSLIALALLASLQATASPPVRVSVADLLGHTPGDVAVILGAPAAVDPSEAVRIVEDGRAVDIYPAKRFHRAWPEG